MTDEALPPMDACGFMRVPTVDDTALWMTCDACSKSDHFWIDGESIRCRCGASYSHAVRPDGETFPIAQLTFVPFAKGPMDLADTEWDPKRLAVLGIIACVALTAIGGLIWYVTAG
ncbi:MAG: hypothetical protein AB8H79_21395 [Myxococcota bacterium]